MHVHNHQHKGHDSALQSPVAYSIEGLAQLHLTPFLEGNLISVRSSRLRVRLSRYTKTSSSFIYKKVHENCPQGEDIEKNQCTWNLADYMKKSWAIFSQGKCGGPGVLAHGLNAGTGVCVGVG